MTQLTLYVQGISYVDHLHAIEQCIQNLRGIESVKGTLPKGKITVKFKQSFVSTRDIVGRIEAHGFEVVKKIQREHRFSAFN
ncbi:heavy-metal-associated domain-containing protein [Bacillus tuaregi]|uniref:heavy-metal-associated domain-containing protein n=1 Tax=Bacillus tuaregi TaxID=1816695 RepID=UPI0008F7F02A|nr:heavy-metal-associated domain-containing protein [Bacillus tuaregi]